MDEVTGFAAPHAEIAGFGRRLLAFVIDSLLLGVLGSIAGLLAFDALAALGDWGRAGGFAVALSYFGVLESGLFGGQSLGKRAVGIRVVTAAGVPLSPAASMLRAAIFCVPYFLNGASMGVDLTNLWFSTLLTFLVFGVGLSIGYLLVFNRRTRQSIHDLAVGAYVVSGKIGGPVGGNLIIWRGHFGAVVLILVGSLLLPILVQRLAKLDFLVPLVAVQQGLENVPDVRHATVIVGVTTLSSTNNGTTQTHELESRIILSQKITDLDVFANRMALIILESDVDAEKEDRILISLVYGYDIGIASAWHSRDFAFSPAEWRQRISTGTN